MFGLVLPSDLRGPFSNPFELFPEELWRMMFEALKNPQDLLNMMHSTDEWYHMLAKERIIFLFPKVLEIMDPLELLSDKVEDFELNDERTTEIRKKRTEYFEGTNDMVVKRGGRTGRRRRTNSEVEEEERKMMKEEEEYQEYLLKRKPFLRPIFQCRLVCKSWKHAIQNFLQSHPMHYSMDLDNFDMNCEIYQLEIGVERLRFHCDFGEKNNVDKFLDHFQATHPSNCNPFLSSQLYICQKCQPEQPLEFCNAITYFLEKYGSHLRHLFINLLHCNCHRIPPATFYPLFQHWLQLTPNLETLRLDVDRSVEYEDARLMLQEEVRLAAQIELAPLPKLDQLVLLRTTNIPAAICQQLLQRNGHIKTLQNSLGYEMSYPDYNTYFRQVTFNNLSELWIEMNSRSELVQLETALAGCRWPLKTLNINGFNEESFQEWPEWHRLFNIVEEAFGETLTHFWVHLPNPECYLDRRTTLEESFDLRLNLPCLKQMRMRIPCLSSIDFLLSLDNTLEELSILIFQTPMSAFDKAKEKIKFNGMLDRMEESNIWEMLPELRLLEVIILNDSDPGASGWLRPQPLGHASAKYLYKKHAGSGNVDKIKIGFSEFQWNVIFSKSQPSERNVRIAKEFYSFVAALQSMG